MRFAAAPSTRCSPRDKPLKPYVAAVKASVHARADPLVRPGRGGGGHHHLAGSLAAQAEGRSWATLVPHVMPTGEPGFPIYSVGAVYPRTAVGRRVWGLVRPLVMTGEEQGAWS